MMLNLRTCLLIMLFGTSLLLAGNAQERAIGVDTSATDRVDIPYPVRDLPFLNLYPWRKSSFSLVNPSNIQREIVFDPVSRQYVIREKVGNTLYRPPLYFSFDEYQRYENRLLLREGWETFSDQAIHQYRTDRIIPTIYVESEAFERIFGSNRIDIIPRGTADITLRGQRNRNENPMYNERQRRQWGFDFDQRIQMNLTGQIGERLRLTTNYNTQAQFDFENQMRLDYIGGDDDIIRRIEVGNVSMPLNTTLITGTESLFGVKTQLQFGRLHVTGVFSQQKSQQQEILIRNGAQESQFSLKADAYEDNQHYFLAQYFRDTFKDALRMAPLIRTNINITQIEVWISNRSNAVDGSRDVLALLDLGESNAGLYNNTGLIPSGMTHLPSTGIPGEIAPQVSNQLIAEMERETGGASRLTRSTSVRAFFEGGGHVDPISGQPDTRYRANDNFAKLTYARKLNEGTDYTVDRRLGFISLRMPLQGDQVLAVAYRYTANGREYQVGELSTDVPVTPSDPTVLYTKLLRNEVLKTHLPTWDLMMKNIYSIGAYQVGSNNFKFQIYRLDDSSGVERPMMYEGERTANKLWIQLTGLDRLNPQQARQPDGYFDFLPGITIDADLGRVMFPVLEPFGKDLDSLFAPSERDLALRYTFQPLYDSTKTIAQQLFPEKNRYMIKGSYESEAGTEFQLGAINVPYGSVQVFAGNTPLKEGVDFLVDYNIGRVRILNQALLHSGQPIRIKMENSQLFGLQQRTMMGGRLDFVANDRLQLGSTLMRLSERPLTQKVMIGEEPISNTMWGFDFNYHTPSRWLTRMVDKIPFIDTKEESHFSLYGEFASLHPGNSRALNFAGSRNGTTYIDDFENTRSFIDLKGAFGWQIAGTPQAVDASGKLLFPEWDRTNDLAYGYNRAHLAFYNIDPIFYRRSSSLTPSNIDNAELSDHRVREVLEQEVFPFKESATGLPMSLPTLDLAYYPTIRGPYNYTTTDIDPITGRLLRPETRWGGIFRKIDVPDFESQNVEFIEVWMMDPFVTNRETNAGDLYFNLGNISEDILKDGRKAMENGMSPTGDLSGVDSTVWGRVPKRQPVVQAFDNDPAARARQDIGIDGLSDADERMFHADFLSQMQNLLSPEAFQRLWDDPSGDNFRYYRGSAMDADRAGILKRYQHFNGMEGNARTPEQSQNEFGVETAAATLLPDGEDISRDNNMSEIDEYYQYRLALHADSMKVGQNHITDIHEAEVRLPNGRTERVKWYQFRIPLAEGVEVGGIKDFKSIRFMRMFMTGFSDTTVLRLAQLQLVRGEWRRYNAEDVAEKIISDVPPRVGGQPSGSQVPRVSDGSTFAVSAVNIEQNGNRRPIPYVVPPGIERQLDWGNMNSSVQLNEQSLSLEVANLKPGHGRAAYRTTSNDFRAYGRLEMFVHAEALPEGSRDRTRLEDDELKAFIRLGTDDRFNYYQYEIPLKVTNPALISPENPNSPLHADAIWPEENRMNVELALFQRAKLERNRLSWPVDVPFVYDEGGRRIVVVGQPDLSNVRFYMLGVINPQQSSEDHALGEEKSAIVWFNELRLTEFDRKSGWAATARMQMRLADFAEVTVSGRKSTVGFGSLDQRIGSRHRSEDLYLDLVANAELGKFFRADHGVRIPFYFSYTNQRGTPEYNPLMPDMELKSILDLLDRSERQRLLQEVQDYMHRRSFSFTNVRKVRTNIEKPVRLWDIENWSATYSFAEQFQRDHVTEVALQQRYRGALDYSFGSGGQYVIEPFKKLIKTDYLALLRDVNFNLMPSLLHFRIDVDRVYNENRLRENNSPDNFIPVMGTLYNKNFSMNRVYGISWNLSRSLKLDFNATNYAIIDEPDGRLGALQRDTLWSNFWRLGRTTDYNHMLNVTYSLPMDRIPGLDWVQVDTRYGAQFTWQTEPLFSQMEGLDLGNSIQNGRTIQVNPRLALTGLYNRIGFIRNRTGPGGGGGVVPFLLQLLTGVKDIHGAYTRVENTFLPGYTPRTDLFGYDFDLDAPGVGFLFGGQRDIRQRALDQGWITRSPLQNQLYMNSLTEDISLRALAEPLRGLQVELSALRLNSRNYTTLFRYHDELGPDGAPIGFEKERAPFTNGTFSISYLSIGTAFKDHDQLFKRFEANRLRASQRLGANNPNSVGIDGNGYADGYGKNAQEVVLHAFLATYGQSDIDNFSVRQFPKIPIPNWRLSYAGLGNLPFFRDFLASFNIHHGYHNQYSVSGYQSTPAELYHEQQGAPAQKDGNGNFLPKYQFQQLSIFEQFAPLLGVDIRFRNGMTANAEYRSARTLSLSLQNSQLSMLMDRATVVGLGYRANGFQMPFGWFSGRRLENDLNFRMDFALNDLKTTVYRSEVEDSEVSAGNKSISVRPSVDYMINQRFQIRVFYDSNSVRPYTSQTFATSYANFGFTLRVMFQ